MTNPVSRPITAALLYATLAPAVAADPGDPVTITFENDFGATTVTQGGSAWTDGQVLTAGVPSFYASGVAAWEPDAGGSTVLFDEAIDEITMFFVHGEGGTPGTVTAFDALDQEVDSGQSFLATTKNFPDNFLTLQGTGIVRLSITGVAWVDDPTFTEPGTVVPPPPPGDIDIVLGDKVQADAPAEGSRTITFEAAAGTSVTLKLKRTSGAMTPQLRLTAPSLTVLVQPEDSAVSPKSARIKNLPLTETGTYSVDVMDQGLGGGTWKLSSRGRGPKTIKTIVGVPPPGDGSDPAPPFHAVSGTTLRRLILRSLKPKGDFALILGQPADLFPLISSITGPDPEPDEELEFEVKTSKSGRKTTLADLALPNTGNYTVTIGGADNSVGYAKMTLALRIPKGKTLHDE